MVDADLTVFAGTRWSALNHDAARARLVRAGWTPCGEGDWAIALRSPGGRLAARISPFEPSYGWFVELCRRGRDNPYLPRIDLATELEGGGHLAVLEHLTWVGEKEEEAFLRRWRDDHDPDPWLRTLREQVHTLDHECGSNVPYWTGVDLEDHVMRAADGQIKLIDLFVAGGGPMMDQIDTDIDAFFAAIPPERCAYLLQIPHFSRDYARPNRERLVAAFVAYERAGGRPSSLGDACREAAADGSARERSG